MGDVMNALKRLDLEMVDQDFGLHPNLHIQIRKSDTERILQLFKSYVANVPLDKPLLWINRRRTGTIEIEE
ncbi:MAG: hypothetical protein R2769_09110 [Saprospiraceae bacterium]